MSVLALFIVLLFSSNQVGAQDVNIISGNQSNQPVQTAVPDTFPLLDLDETELDKIPDLRAQFEKKIWYMFKHYVKVALRLIKRSFLFSSVNMLGFVLGMTAAFLIYLWIVDELTF